MTVENDQVTTIIDDTVNEPTTPAVEENEPPKVDDPVATLLSEIKREDGSQKYADAATALKALKDSQAHIQTIESENQSLKEKLELYKEKAEQNMATEDILKALTADKTDEEQPSGNSVKTQDIKKLFEEFLTEHETTKNVKANQTKVAQAILSKFGDKAKAEAFYIQKAKENEISVDFLNSLAGHSPDATIKLLGLDQIKSAVGQEDVKSEVNTESWKQPKKETQAPTRVLRGATSADLMAAWNKAKEKVVAQ